jgi:hypothetical protein
MNWATKRYFNGLVTSIGGVSGVLTITAYQITVLAILQELTFIF